METIQELDWVLQGIHKVTCTLQKTMQVHQLQQLHRQQIQFHQQPLQPPQIHQQVPIVLQQAQFQTT